MHILFFFETLKVRKFYKENEERITQFEFPCNKTASFYLFLYICQWRQILLKKRGQRTLITVVLWGTFHQEKYQINSFVQDNWIADFQCNEFGWNKLHCFFESSWSEQDSYTPIFSMYMTVARRTQEDNKYFKGKLYSFFCNYLEYHLVSWGSNLRNLFVSTFIYHHYFHLGQSIQECTKIYLVHSRILCPIYPCQRDAGILQVLSVVSYILQKVTVARRQNFKMKHSPGITLSKSVWFSRRKSTQRKLKFRKYIFFIL